MARFVQPQHTQDLDGQTYEGAVVGQPVGRGNPAGSGGFPAYPQQRPNRAHAHINSGDMSESQQHIYDTSGNVVPPPMSFALGTRWVTGLCDCLHDTGSCVDVVCCPYCQVGFAYHRTRRPFVDMDAAVCIAACCADFMLGGTGTTAAAMVLRNRVVQRYRLEEQLPATLLKGCFCAPCTLCQVHREMKMRGEYPGGVCLPPECSLPANPPAQNGGIGATVSPTSDASLTPQEGSYAGSMGAKSVPQYPYYQPIGPAHGGGQPHVQHSRSATFDGAQQQQQPQGLYQHQQQHQQYSPTMMFAPHNARRAAPASFEAPRQAPPPQYPPQGTSSRALAAGQLQRDDSGSPGVGRSSDPDSPQPHSSLGTPTVRLETPKTGPCTPQTPASRQQSHYASQ